MKEKAKSMKKLLGALAVAFVMTMVMGMAVSAAPASTYISPGKSVVNTDRNGNVAHYYKVIVKSTGNLYFTGYSQSYYGYNSGLYITLCNANGKALDTQQYVRAVGNDTDSWTYKSYGVKKGTYLVKVQTSDAFELVHGFTKLKVKGGASQKKATALAKGKTVYNVSTIGTKNRKVDYFKITLKKPQKEIKFQIYNYFHNNSTLKFKVIAPKSVRYSGSYRTVYNDDGVEMTLKYLYSSKKLPKGTYYIQVTRANRKSSVNGVYGIKRTK